MEFPGSPYHVLERLLEEYRNGQRSADDLSRSLDIFDLFVDQWSEGMKTVPVHPEVLPEGPATIEESMQGLGCFSEASAVMRDFLSNGDDQLAEQALELARQGHDTLAGLLLSTRKKVEELQNEVG